MGKTWEELNFQYYQNAPAKTPLTLLGATTQKYPPLVAYFHSKAGMMNSACRKRWIRGCTILGEDKNMRRGSHGHHIQLQHCTAVSAYGAAGCRAVPSARLVGSLQMRQKQKLSWENVIDRNLNKLFLTKTKGRCSDRNQYLIHSHVWP